MARLSIYTSDVGRKVATVSPGAAAAEAAGPYQTAAKVAGLGAAWAEWKAENQKKDDAVKVGLTLAQSALEWEQTQSEAQTAGGYTIDGELVGLIDGRVDAFRQHREGVMERLGGIDDKSVRKDAMDAYALQSMGDEIKLQQEYRQQKQETQQVGTSAAISQLSELGKYGEAQALLNNAVNSGIFNSTEYDAVRDESISSYRSSEWNEILATTDDVSGTLAAVADDPYLSPADREQIEDDAYSLSEQRRVTAERVEKEVWAKNEADWLVNNDPARTANSVINRLDIDPSTKHSWMMANHGDAAAPPVSAPEAIELAEQIISDVQLSAQEPGAAKMAISGIAGLSSGDKAKYGGRVDPAANSAAMNPEMDIQLDYMSKQILKVPENAWNFGTGSGVDIYQIWSDAERDFRMAAADEGPTFDPRLWVKTNLQDYMDRANEAQGNAEVKGPKWAVYSSPGVLDEQASITGLKKAGFNDPDVQQTMLNDLMTGGNDAN